MISALRENKQAFCLEPWELHDFAQIGEDPDGVISHHVEHCPLCSEDIRTWKSALSEEPMPAELWSQVRKRLPMQAGEQILSVRPKWSQILWENLVRFWKGPAMAAGAVAAVLLLVVIFYQAPIEPMIPKAKSIPQKTALVVLFKDFKVPLPQDQIDSLYEALEPSRELNDRYNIISPAETSEVIKSGKVPSDDESAMIEGLRKNLDVSRVLVVVVFPSADKLAARIEFIDTISGKTLQTRNRRRNRKE